MIGWTPRTQHFTVDSVFGAVPVRMDGAAIQVLLAQSRLSDPGTRSPRTGR
jgi:hypothetical protein